MVKYLSSTKINGTSPLNLNVDRTNGYIEQCSGNKYFSLIPTDESRDSLKKYVELWSKIRDLTRLITNNSNDYDKKYIKIKFNSEDDLSLNKTLKLYIIVIFVRSVFHEGNKYYPQVFLDECLYKL